MNTIITMHTNTWTGRPEAIRRASFPYCVSATRPTCPPAASPAASPGVDLDDLHVLAEEAARVGDVDGRLLFVSGQHPDHDTGLSEGTQRLRHPLLEAVLDARTTWG